MASIYSSVQIYDEDPVYELPGVSARNAGVYPIRQNKRATSEYVHVRPLFVAPARESPLVRLFGRAQTKGMVFGIVEKFDPLRATDLFQWAVWDVNLAFLLYSDGIVLSLPSATSYPGVDAESEPSSFNDVALIGQVLAAPPSWGRVSQAQCSAAIQSPQ